MSARRTGTALCLTLVRRHGGLGALVDGRGNQACRFVDAQLGDMPAHFGLAFGALTRLLAASSRLRHGRAFHALPYAQREAVLDAWRASRMSALRDFVRLHETLVVFSLADASLREGMP